MGESTRLTGKAEALVDAILELSDADKVHIGSALLVGYCRKLGDNGVEGVFDNGTSWLFEVKFSGDA